MFLWWSPMKKIDWISLGFLLVSVLLSLVFWPQPSQGPGSHYPEARELEMSQGDFFSGYQHSPARLRRMFPAGVLVSTTPRVGPVIPPEPQAPSTIKNPSFLKTLGSAHFNEVLHYFFLDERIGKTLTLAVGSREEGWFLKEVRATMFILEHEGKIYEISR